MRDASLQVVFTPGIMKMGYNIHPWNFHLVKAIAWDFHLLMTWNHSLGYNTFAIRIKPRVSVTQPHYVPSANSRVGEVGRVTSDFPARYKSSGGSEQPY